MDDVRMTGTGARSSLRATAAAIAAAAALGGTPARVHAAAADGSVSASPVEDAAGLPTDPAAAHAIGRVLFAGPAPRELVALSSGGYGYTGSALGAGDAHHRAAGSLALEGRPLSWFGMGLRFDGRYDLHSVPGQPHDDGLVGDPRLHLRVDGALGERVRGGVRIGLWMPGGVAPSIRFGALTPEATAAVTYAAATVPLWLSANAGYRLDRSARTVTDADRLSASDRLALEVSAYDQALLGLGAVYGAGRWQGFLEAAADLLVGSGHPAFSTSPLRVGAGARWAWRDDLRLEGGLELTASTTPSVAPAAPLVPVPPRAAVWMGLAYRFDRPARAARSAGADERGAAAREGAARARAATGAGGPESLPPMVSLIGRVVSSDGGATPDASLTIESDGETSRPPVDAEGRFTFSSRRGRALSVKVEATGYQPLVQDIHTDELASSGITLTLQRRLPSGQIRGLVRSFHGEALDARVHIEPDGSSGAATDAAPDTAAPGQSLRTSGGRFEADVAPGAYQVTITVPGYVTQKRRLRVEQNGVTVLNVDLRSAR